MMVFRRFSLLAILLLPFCSLVAYAKPSNLNVPGDVFAPQAYLPLLSNETEALRFAVIGDYGTGTQAEQDVAALVKSWSPEFIITTGDNNYPEGSAATIDLHIGQYYHDFIFPYKGQYGAGAEINRFFPSLGNHDWLTAEAAPYRDYFTLPGNERYYTFTWGPLALFAVNSVPGEPDGVTASSPQATWLRDALAASEACWNLVYMHHPPFSSGAHGSSPWMQWPYQAWGADAVLAGHDHTYERILNDGLVYFVNGLGGQNPYAFGALAPGSQFRYNADYGAMLVEATRDRILFQFIARSGELVDTYSQQHNCSARSNAGL